MTAAAQVDAPGTCHLVGCPGKGEHAPHGIGVGRWADYSAPAVDRRHVTSGGLPLFRDHGLILTAVVAGRPIVLEPDSACDLADQLTDWSDRARARQRSLPT